MANELYEKGAFVLEFLSATPVHEGEEWNRFSPDSPVHGFVLEFSPESKMYDSLSRGMKDVKDILSDNSAAMSVIYECKRPLNPSWRIFELATIAPNRMINMREDVLKWMTSWMDKGSGASSILYEQESAEETGRGAVFVPRIDPDSAPLHRFNITGKNDIFRRTFWAVDPTRVAFPDDEVVLSMNLKFVPFPGNEQQSWVFHTNEAEGVVKNTTSIISMLNALETKSVDVLKKEFPQELVIGGRTIPKYGGEWLCLVFDWFLSRQNHSPMNMYPLTRSPSPTYRSLWSIQRLFRAFLKPVWQVLWLSSYHDRTRGQPTWEMDVAMCTPDQIYEKISAYSYLLPNRPWTSRAIWKIMMDGIRDSIQWPITCNMIATDWNAGVLAQDEMDRHLHYSEETGPPQPIDVMLDKHMIVANMHFIDEGRLDIWSFTNVNLDLVRRNTNVLFMYHSRLRGGMKEIPQRQAALFMNSHFFENKVNSGVPLSAVDIIDLFADLLPLVNVKREEFHRLFPRYAWAGTHQPYNRSLAVLNALDFSVYVGKDLLIQVDQGIFFHTGVAVPLATVPTLSDYDFTVDTTDEEGPIEAPELGELHVADLQFMNPMPKSAYGRTAVLPNFAVLQKKMETLEKDPEFDRLERTHRSEYLHCVAISRYIRNRPELDIFVHFLAAGPLNMGKPMHASVKTRIRFPVIQTAPFQHRGQTTEDAPKVMVTSRFSPITYKELVSRAFNAMMETGGNPLRWDHLSPRERTLITASPLYVYVPLTSKTMEWRSNDFMGQAALEDNVCVDQLFLAQTTIAGRKTHVEAGSVGGNPFYASVFVYINRNIVFPRGFREPDDNVWAMYKNPYYR